MTPTTIAPGRARVPLFVQVLLAAAAGAGVGVVIDRYGGLHGVDLGAAGMLVIKVLKILATPLVFLAVIDAALRIAIPARKAATFLAIAGVNAAVAVGIGFGTARATGAGEGAFGAILGAAKGEMGRQVSASVDPPGFAMSLPASIVEPFATGSIFAVVVLALLTGFALRAVRPTESEGVAVIDKGIRAALSAVTVCLHWFVGLIPIAVFAVVAHVVSTTGFNLVGDLGSFLGTMILGMLVHVFVYDALVIALVGRRSPLGFFRGAVDALATALSCGSSLATLPVTLRCLDRLKVSPGSTRLATCVGTNLNHDGIILYEGAAAVFVAQAIGLSLGVGDHVAIAAAAVTAGIGIAGIPEAGLITLPLVLAAAGIPAPVIALVVPVLLPVDWIVGRFRAATNVASDMVVAVVLDRLSPTVGGEADQ